MHNMDIWRNVPCLSWIYDYVVITIHSDGTHLLMFDTDINFFLQLSATINDCKRFPDDTNHKCHTFYY